MAEVQDLALPARLEAFGVPDWRHVPGVKNSLGNILQLQQSLSDGLVTIFDAWQEDGGVDPRRFFYAVDSIGHQMVDSSIVVINEKMALDDYVFVQPDGSYWERPMSMGSLVWREDDGSPKNQYVLIHLSTNSSGMTTEVPTVAA